MNAVVTIEDWEWEVYFNYYPSCPSSFFDPGELEDYEIISVAPVELALHLEQPTDEQIIEQLKAMEPDYD